ncbi:MAG: helix-turn-helix transcriptional regulator [Cyclobacteriaceae bacterium]
MHLGATIKKFRLKKGLTQQELAEHIGTRINYISDIETGKRNPGNKLVDQIAEMFGVNPIFLKFDAMEEEDIKREERQLFNSVKPLISDYLDGAMTK